MKIETMHLQLLQKVILNDDELSNEIDGKDSKLG